MKTKIPSPVLARIQLMFQSGATLDEVTKSLDLDTTWEQPVLPPTVRPAQAQVVTKPDVLPANDERSPRLADLSSKLQSHVQSLFERDDVRDVPALSGALDAIYQHATAIRNEVESPSQDVAVKKAATSVVQPAKKPAVSEKKAAISQPKLNANAAPPPAMKVQPPAKKKARETLRPTGELPSAGRRDVAHPFAASLSDDKSITRTSPAVTKSAPEQSSPVQSTHAYRDRLARVMSEFPTFSDKQEHDEDVITARNS